MQISHALLGGSLLCAILVLVLCQTCSQQEDQPLNHYGFHDYDAASGDTIYHSIRDFSFTDQNGNTVTQETFKDKIYIADFFFTSCPTICPKVTKEMLRIYDKYADDERVMLLSHTVDPKRDSVDRLKQYAEGIGVDDDRWRFVTGDKKELYAITYDYMSTALENEDAPGGVDHSGYILLVDPDRHLRAYANGTLTEEVDRFIADIDRLLAELDKKSAQQVQ